MDASHQDSDPDKQLIIEAVLGIIALERYQFTLVLTDTDKEHERTLAYEGVIVRPDGMYVKETVGDSQLEMLTVGSNTYIKSATQPWTLKPALDSRVPTPTTHINPANLAIPAFGNLNLDSYARFTYSDEPHHDGTVLRHYEAKELWGDSVVELWIDPATKLLHKLTSVHTFGPGAHRMIIPSEPGRHTVVEELPPGQVIVTTGTISYSRFNDPTITIPAL